MKPTYESPCGRVTLYHAGNLAALPSISDCHSCVTDPPYGLKFMGKKWDYDVPSVEQWEAVLEALLPGASLLSFAGTRTQHRMAVRIEDGGFEIRDMLAWVYGSGFPKSLDVGKAIDKMAGAEREVVWMNGTAADIRGNSSNGNGISSDASKKKDRLPNNITAPATEAAKQWDGWGTALKPALEPITLARKPLIGTVAANVLAHGVGGINVDGCRVATDPSVDDARLGGAGTWSSEKMAKNVYEGGYAGTRVGSSELGRFPANLIHDGSPEVLAGFPQTTSGKPGIMRKGQNTGAAYGAESREPGTEMTGFGDSGSAARFFYCAKSSKSERNLGVDGGNSHPTVKPLALMRYLCRLVTPPGGIVLDPWMGSGTTAVAALREGFRFVGIERDPEHFATAVARIQSELAKADLFSR